MEPRGPKAESKKDWALTQSAFRRLLDWLDDGSGSEGQRYLEIRQRLAQYFDRKSCLEPDDLADETLNRVTRRLEEEGAITSDTPAHYCYIVARFVFLEYLRKPEDEEFADHRNLDSAARNAVAVSSATEQQIQQEKRWECFGRCLQGLEAGQRELIMSYYTGNQGLKIENRRRLAAKLAITINALSIRACRIREKLEKCVSRCLENR